MKIRAQIGMVLNLDKCIGCHTCSVTCKNVWTSREGRRIRLVQQRRDQAGHRLSQASGRTRRSWNGGWRRKANGKIEPRMGAKWRILAKIFANPDLPEIDDYYEPFDFDYGHLQTAPEMKAFSDRAAALADHRQADGEDRMGPELGGDPRRRVRQAVEGRQLRGHPEGDLRPVRKHLHDVPAEAVRALPQPHLRGRLPLRRDLQARGRRHRPDRPGQVPRLAHVRLGLPLQEDLLQLVDSGKSEKCTFCFPRIEVGTADGLFRDLRRPHPLSRRAALRRRPHRGGRQHSGREGPLPGPARHLPRSARPGGDRPGARRRRAGSLARGGPPRPVYKMAIEWKVAFPLHPEYRTLPMVWYVPPLSPIQSAAAAGPSRWTARCRM
jgi:nitrate reductase beta subunit